MSEKNNDHKTNPEQQETGAKKPWIRVGLGVLKWSIMAGIVVSVTAGATVTGYVAALVRDDEVRSRETIMEAMGQNAETGFVYFNDGTVVGQLRTEEDRRLVTYDEVPKAVEDAVIATEDEDFENHIGVDVSGLMRAVKQKLLNEEIQTGGSTITQQLARRVFLSLDKTDSRKFKEILLSLRLERYMTKEDILTAYLNKVPYGNGSSGYNLYGIKAAAHGIFDKELSELNIAQSAYLAGLPQLPSVYSAFTGKGEFDAEGFARAKERQELVLSRMLATGKISSEEYEEAVSFDLKASLAPPAEKAYATYPYLMLEAERQAAEVILRQQFPDLTEEQMRGPEYRETLDSAREMLLRSGYRIYTTIDKTVYDAMHRISDNPELFTKDHERKGMEQVGAMLIDNDTGKILGMIEGRDFYKEQLNHATQMLRQPGSAMKPIAAYLPALESGAIQPAGVLDDTPILLPDASKGVHIPQNWDQRYHGLMTAREALNQSWNIPALKLFLDQVTIPKAWEFAKSLGITSITESDYHARTGVIGGLEYGVSVEELTNAFAAIANGGTFQDAFFIEKITDSEGRIIYEHKPSPKDVFSEQTAYLMTDMLRTVITSGTATEVRRVFEHEDKIPIVGKTGTTSDNYDLWFVGYSPDVTLGVWIGYDQPAVLTESLRAKRVWAQVMNELVASKESLFVTDSFTKPEGIVSKTVSAVSGLLPSETVQKANLTVTDLFQRQYIPTKVDDVLQSARVVLVNGKAYLPQPGTPEDMSKESLVVVRSEPISELMKRIEEAIARQSARDRKPLERYRPTDGFGDAPTEIDPRIEDGRVPDAPPKLTILKTEDGVKVMFAPSPNSDVAGYRAYRSADGGPWEPLPSKTVLMGEPPSFIDQVPANRLFGYYLVAVDIAGQTSPPSEPVFTGESFVSPGMPSEFDADVEPPTAPAKPEAGPRQLGVKLMWMPNPVEQSVTTYHVSVAQQEQGPYMPIGSTEGTTFEYITLSVEGWYRIIAENGGGQSPPSEPVYFKPAE